MKRTIQTALIAAAFSLALLSPGSARATSSAGSDAQDVVEEYVQDEYVEEEYAEDEYMEETAEEYEEYVEEGGAEEYVEESDEESMEDENFEETAEDSTDTQ